MAPRNLRSEYDNYHAKPEQKRKRASRNAARAKMIKAGKAAKGDGKDVAHVNGNALVNSMSNLRMESPKKNRSYARTKSARKVDPKA